MELSSHVHGVVGVHPPASRVRVRLHKPTSPHVVIAHIVSAHHHLLLTAASTMLLKAIGIIHAGAHTVHAGHVVVVGRHVGHVALGRGAGA